MEKNGNHVVVVDAVIEILLDKRKVNWSVKLWSAVHNSTFEVKFRFRAKIQSPTPLVYSFGYTINSTPFKLSKVRVNEKTFFIL